MKHFSEMTKDEQREAIEAVRNSDSYLDYNWYEGTDDDFKAILETIGFYEPETRFSGFSSQGDGASFKGYYSYETGSVQAIEAYAPKDEELQRITKEFKAIQAKACYDIEFVLTYSHSNYVHENTMHIEARSRRGNIKEETAEQYEDELLQLCKDLAGWYYKKLEADYDYLNSDECIMEHIKANDEDS